MKICIIFSYLIWALLITCNNSDWVLYRAGQDYFPLKGGNYWKYDKGNVVELVEVKGETIAYGNSVWHLLRNGASEYWTKNGKEVKQLIIRKINYGGTDYILQQSWLLEYKLPFVLGNFWSDVFTDTVIILGDTFRIKQTVFRKIWEVSDITVPAGTFTQVYKIEFYETFSLNNYYEQQFGYEWFAPGVGLIKRVYADTTESLIEYRSE
ncbi:MAG: hypothetical protein ABIK61_01445 [candidate division WOR-3 bacterium]